MKNAYLNGMFNFRVYQCVIQKKKNKNTLLINQKQEEKQEKNTSKYSPYIPVDCVERKYLKILRQ